MLKPNDTTETLSPRGETKVTNSEINTNQDKQAAKTITKDKNKH